MTFPPVFPQLLFSNGFFFFRGEKKFAGDHSHGAFPETSFPSPVFHPQRGKLFIASWRAAHRKGLTLTLPSFCLSQAGSWDGETNHIIYFRQPWSYGGKSTPGKVFHFSHSHPLLRERRATFVMGKSDLSRKVTPIGGKTKQEIILRKSGSFPRTDFLFT